MRQRLYPLLKRKKVLNPIILLMCLLWSGCQTAPKSYSQFQEGEWVARALIQDREKKKHVVDLDIKAEKRARLRVDATAGLGTPLASFILDGQKFDYLLLRQKKYYSGEPNPEALKPVIGLSFNPEWFHNLLFEIPIPTKDWSCSMDENSLLTECRRLRGKTLIRWSLNENRQKKITIENAGVRVEIVVLKFRPKVENAERIFRLKRPSSFTTI